MSEEVIYHDFEIGDYVYLKHAFVTFEITSDHQKYVANTTPPGGIRYATSEEIEKLTGSNQ